MVDLIPADYRRARRLQRWLRGFAFGCVVLLASMGLARVALLHASGVEREASARAQAENASGATERARIDALATRRQEAQARVRLLDGMRGAAPVGGLFTAIDEALDERVRFEELAFSREAEAQAGASATGATAAGAAAVAGVAAVSAPATPPGGAASGTSARRRMEIRGRTPDHAALSSFIRRLRASPGIVEVRLLDTTMSGEADAQAVGFNLLVLLDALPEDGR